MLRVITTSRLRSTPVRVAGAALSAVSAGMLLCAGVAAVDGGGSGAALVYSALITGAVGLTMLAKSRVSERADPAISFAAVAWSWVVVSVAGSLPYLLSGTIGWVNADDALYEAVSGFTCTGSTILTNLDALPNGLLLYRQMTQWFGGMGLIVLAVAVLPALKVGGLELIASEAPGPGADRLTPRISETARRLWFLYGAVTVVVTVALLAAGLSLFDAVAHGFTTAATGGFSTHSASIGYFDSVTVELIIAVGMLYGGANYAMHWQLLTGGGRSFRGFSELRWWLTIVAGALGLLLLLNAGELSFGANLRESFFYVASFGSSTGFSLTDYTVWVPAAQLVVLLLMVLGAMTGSTAGGMKVFRLQLAVRYAVREVIRARHPRAVVPMQLGSLTVGEQVAARAIGFVLLYLGLIIVGGVMVTAFGSDPLTGFSGAVSAVGNMGPALGDAGPLDTAAEFTRQGRGVLMVLMLFGRLELFPAMLMFVAAAGAVARTQHERSTRASRRTG